LPERFNHPPIGENMKTNITFIILCLALAGCGDFDNAAVQKKSVKSNVTFTTSVKSSAQVDVVAHFGLGAVGGTSTYSLVLPSGAPAGASLSANEAAIDKNGDSTSSVQNMTPGFEYLVVASVGQSQAVTATSSLKTAAKVRASNTALAKDMATPITPASGSVTVQTISAIWPTDTSITTSDPSRTQVLPAAGPAGVYSMVRIWDGTTSRGHVEKKDNNGVSVWSSTTPVSPSWIAVGNNVYVGDGNTIYRLDPTSGAVMSGWPVPIPSNTWGNLGDITATFVYTRAVAVSDGVIVDAGDTLIKYDIYGVQQWTRTLPVDARHRDGLPSLVLRSSADDVYLVLPNGDTSLLLMKIDNLDGTNTFSIPFATNPALAAMVADNTGPYILYYISETNQTAVQHYTPTGMADGSAIFTANINGFAPDAEAAYNGYLYLVPPLAGTIYRYSISSGNETYLQYGTASNISGIYAFSVYAGTLYCAYGETFVNGIEGI
jgi:hypothetical protein